MSTLMKQKTVPAEVISQEVGNAVNAMRSIMERGKVNLKDTDDVIKRTEEYMEACALTGTFPSMMGLCSYAFGMYKNSVMNFMKTNPGHSTTEYLRMVTDMIADVLTNASLNNSANPIQTMFQLKNHYGHEDHVKLEAYQATSLLSAARSKAEIAEKYKEGMVDG